jgi:hypothetical protein
METTRRRFLGSAASVVAEAATPRIVSAAIDPIAVYRTPYKYPEFILRATGRKGDFDERSVDDPIIFRANGRF